MLIVPSLANVFREMVIKTLKNEKMSTLPCGSTWLFSEHSQSKPGDKERKIFSNDFPNDFSAYKRFKFGSRDGQDLGQPTILGSARRWGQLVIFGLNQEHLLFFTSQDR